MKKPLASSSISTGPLSGLRRFNPGMLSLHNALHCPREPLMLDWNGYAARLHLVHAVPSLPDDVCFRLHVDDEVVDVACSWQALDGLGAHPARQRSLREVDLDLVALWLESVWLFWLEPLETFLGTDIRIEPVRKDDTRKKRAGYHTATTMTLSLTFESGNESHLLHVGLSETLLIRLRPLLERYFTRRQSPASAVTTSVTLCMGSQRLALSEWQSLRPGDVVLLERPSIDPTQARVIVGECYTATASIGSGEPILLGSLRPARVLQAASEVPLSKPDQKEGSMNESSSDKDASPDQAQTQRETVNLDDLPLRLTCELGRLDLTLGELRELGEGSVLPLGRRPERAVDLVVNGRRMGLGRLVTIGDDLGVQIERLDLDG